MFVHGTFNKHLLRQNASDASSVAATRRAGKPPGGLHGPMGIRVSVSGERESIYDLRILC
jgi:hypothetical protein